MIFTLDNLSIVTSNQRVAIKVHLDFEGLRFMYLFKKI